MRVLKTRTALPEPSEAMASRSGVPKTRLEKGYGLFLQNCVQCHEPRIPVDPEAESWHPVMRGMAWNSNMEQGDEEAMIDYVRAAASERH